MGVLELGGDGDFAEEPVRTEGLRELRLESFDSDGTMVLEVDGVVNRGHTATAEFPLDPVAVRHSCLEALQGIGHPAPRICLPLCYNREWGVDRPARMASSHLQRPHLSAQTGPG